MYIDISLVYYILSCSADGVDICFVFIDICVSRLSIKELSVVLFCVLLISLSVTIIEEPCTFIHAEKYYIEVNVTCLEYFINLYIRRYVINFYCKFLTSFCYKLLLTSNLLNICLES